MTPKDVLQSVQENKAQFIDLRFSDLFGGWQHLTVPVSCFDEKSFVEGKGFDGSSVRGFQAIHESDLVLMPDPKTAFLDPFMRHTTLAVICDIHDPVAGKPYTKDPRFVAAKAEAYLRTTGFGDLSYWGPEAEFFVFNEMAFDQDIHNGFYRVDSVEGSWNTGRDEAPNLAYKIRNQEGDFPVPPMDSHQDLRSEMAETMERMGVKVEGHHHEVSTGGQGEIAIVYDTLVAMADKLMKYKYVVKNTARRNGLTATFMPKPLFGDNGSGLHVHQSVWKGTSNTFFDEKGYAGLSQQGIWYIGGLLKHAPALCAILNPTTNSYKRLTPGFEAPVNLVYSQRNRSAACRIPLYSKSPKAKRVEFRTPDPSCNGYLAFAAMLMAGLDGIQNKIDPGAPFDENIFEYEPKKLKKIKAVPASLEDALYALEKDHEFLLKGDVFTPDLIQEWLSYKNAKEVDALRLRPHPYEFVLYHDV